MARRTPSEMIDEVRDNLGGESSETISDTRILRYLNSEYMRICARYPEYHPQNSSSSDVTTSSGTAEYTLSVTDVNDITRLVDRTNKIPMRKISEDQYLRYTVGNESTTTGVPVFWFVSGTDTSGAYKLTFYPTPDGTYTVRVHYDAKRTELVTSPASSSYAPTIHEAWDDAIIAGASEMGWRALQDLDKAFKWSGIKRQYEDAAKKVSKKVSSQRQALGSPVGEAIGRG